MPWFRCETKKHQGRTIVRERGPPTESDGAVFRLIWRMEKEEEEGGCGEIQT